MQRVLEASQHQLEAQADLSIPLEMINKLAEEVRSLKDEQRGRFEELEQLIEESRLKVDQQVRVLAERRLDSQCSGGEPAVLTNGCVMETEEELAEAGNYIRQLSQPGIQLTCQAATVTVRVKSRISAQESSVDEDDSKCHRLDTLDARDPMSVTKRLQSLESEVTEFMTPPRKRSQKKRYSQPAAETVLTSPPRGLGVLTSPPKGLPRQDCLDLVAPGLHRPQDTEEIHQVELEEEPSHEDDRCSESTRELNDDMEEIQSASPTCFVTEFGRTEVHHFEASDPIDDVGDSL